MIDPLTIAGTLVQMWSHSASGVLVSPNHERPCTWLIMSGENNHCHEIFAFTITIWANTKLVIIDPNPDVWWYDETQNTNYKGYVVAFAKDSFFLISTTHLEVI